MGAYKYIQENLEKEYKERNPLYKQRILAWKKDRTITTITYPTNLTRARTLGYKAKNGFVLVRTRIGKGRRKRRQPMGGRKARHNYMFVQPQLSHQAIAEQRCARIYKNLEVLNSYWVGEDGNYKFFEIIMVDPVLIKDVPAIKRTGRVFRGLTSQGKKARGLHAIGKRIQRTGQGGKV